MELCAAGDTERGREGREGGRGGGRGGRVCVYVCVREVRGEGGAGGNGERDGGRGRERKAEILMQSTRLSVCVCQ